MGVLPIRIIFYVILALLSISSVYYGIKSRHFVSAICFLASFALTAFAFEWLMDALSAANYLVTAGGFTDSQWSHQFVTSFACCGLSWLLSVVCITVGLISAKIRVGREHNA